MLKLSASLDVELSPSLKSEVLLQDPQDEPFRLERVTAAVIKPVESSTLTINQVALTPGWTHDGQGEVQEEEVNEQTPQVSSEIQTAAFP